jgi:hypothetical protein
MNTEDYEHRRSSIHEISSRCDGLTIRSKRLISDDLVARDGVETADASLFRAAHYRLIRLVFQQLNIAERPQFCDHSVTSADVRLSVGNKLKS